MYIDQACDTALHDFQILMSVIYEAEILARIYIRKSNFVRHTESVLTILFGSDEVT